MLTIQWPGEAGAVTRWARLSRWGLVLTVGFGGVGRGFADHLRPLAKTPSPQAMPELSRIADGAAARLESARRSAAHTTDAHHASAS